jgi:SpoIID/LytB domain protein
VDSIIGVDDVVGPGKGKRGARRYHGLIVLVPDSDGHISVVNVAEIDTVLKGVVPSEMYATAALDALKAQAVTARGAVFAKLGKRHFADPFTLCANEHCQVYTGLAASQANTDRAVDQTVGELAFLAGELVDSVYSSTCGGHSENAEVVWDTTPKAALRGRPDSENADILLARRVHPFEHGGLGNPSGDHLDPDLSDETQLRAFLASAPDSFCARASFAKANKLRWQRRISSYDMDRLLFRYGVGHVERLEIQGRGVSGRLRALRIIGDQNTVVIQREWPIRQALGFLNSGAFVVDIERDAKGEIAAFVFNGAGWGHGVGMCQVGAIGMAEAGFDYRAILGHYYNGARVRKIY